KRVLGRDVYGFTISLADRRYNEDELVRAAVKELEIDHAFVRVGKRNLMEDLRVLVDYHDQPVSTISYYVHWLLLEAISRNSFRVSISGTGADVLFSGYYDHFLAHLFDLRREDMLRDAAHKAWAEHVKPLIRNQQLLDTDLYFKPGRDHLLSGL